MKRRVSVLGLWLLTAGSLWCLDADSQKLADRYRSILEKNPGQTVVFDRLWKIYAAAGETNALVAEARQQAARAPGWSGLILQRAGQKDEAEKIWREAAAHGDAQAADLLASLLEADGKPAEAAAVLEELKAAPSNAALLMRLGALWQAASQPEKARAAWEEAVALDPNDLSLRQKVAASCLKAGDTESALEHLKIIAEKGSAAERLDALEKITGLHESSGVWKEATASQEMLLSLMGPDYWNLANARRHLFRLRQQAGTLAELEAAWRSEAEKQPNDPAQHLRLAALYDFEGLDVKRLAEIRLAAQLAPKDMKLAREQAALELAIGAPEAAAATYDRILSLHPDDADIVFLRAEVAVLSGQQDAAEKQVEDYVARHQEDESAEKRAREFYERLRLTAPLERRLAQDVKAHPKNEAAVTELAQFYLAEHRYRDAAESLAHFDDGTQTPAEIAARAARFATLLHDAKLDEEALKWARQAAAKDPTYVLQLAELLGAMNDLEGERLALEATSEQNPDTLPKEDLDRRLFTTLQALDRATGNSLDPDKMVRTKIAALTAQAASRKNEAAWVRLARWQRWNGDKAAAAETARQGLAAITNSTRLEEMLADSLAETEQVDEAIKILQKLTGELPDRTVELQRRVGHLELDNGNLDEGLQVFAHLATEHPKDWQAQADLALAQQAGGNWFQAFDTWKTAYRLAPSEARRGLQQSLLNAAARLELYEQALAFLDDAAATEPDKNMRAEIFQQAAAFAVRNHSADAWAARLDAHLKTSPEDPRWKEGLASLLKEQGREDEARTTASGGGTNTDESPEGLEAKAKAAEDARDWAAAAKAVRQLISLTVTPKPSLAMRYANDVERSGEDATPAWESATTRFARDPEVLSAAAIYYERAGDEKRMEDCYRKAARLGGCAPQVYLKLGRLALERGDRLQALEDFEKVLAATRPETTGMEDCLPLPDRILTSTGAPAITLAPGGWKPAAGHAMPWRRNDESTPEGIRLAAIRQAGQLLVNSPDKKKWQEGFRDPLERAWALYYAGETGEAYRQMLALVDPSQPQPQILETLAALALESDDAGWLGKWAEGSFDQSEARWDNILAALSRMLEAGWKPADHALETLFQAAPALQRWQACQFLAKAGQNKAAATLGASVPDQLSNAQATEAWLRIAEWEIANGELDRAQASLDKAIATAVPSCSFNDPLFSAIRARWLLTRPGERPAFEEKLKARLREQKNPGSEAAAAALVAALQGDHSQASREIETLFTYLGPFPSERWPESIQSAGALLEAWSLPRLARDVYRNSVTALVPGKQGNWLNLPRATEQMLMANQISFAATAGERAYFVNGWLSPLVTNEDLLKLTTRFQQSGRDEAAASVFQALCERNPRTEMLCSFIAGLGDYPLLRASTRGYLERLLAEPHPLLRPEALQGAGIRLANLLDQDGDYPQELALLERLQKDFPNSKQVLLQTLPLLTKMGEHKQALALMQKAMTSGAPQPDLLVPYAELLAACGRESEAMAVLETTAYRSDASNQVAAANKLASLAREVGDTKRAAEAGKLLGQEGAKPQTPASAADWRRKVTAINRDSENADERFRAGRALLEENPGPPAEIRDAEFHRLKKLAERNSSLLAPYYVLRKELAVRQNATAGLEKEMTAEWKDGQGQTFAGEILLQLLLEQERYGEIEPILNSYLKPEHFRELSWNEIGKKLMAAHQPALAARVFAALNEEDPGDTKRMLALAQALTQSGQAAQATPLLEAIGRLAELDPAHHLDLAQYELEQGDLPQSVIHLEAALRNPALVNSAAPLWMKVATEAGRQGQWELAGKALRQAARYPQAITAAGVAAYYLGNPQAGDAQSNAFALPAKIQTDVFFEIAHQLLAQGKSNQAWTWIEAIPPGDARWATLLKSVETSDWDRAARLWDTAVAQNTLWDLKAAAAEFYQRRAETRDTPATRLKDLARAHELLPGSYAIAEAYAKTLIEQKKYPAARKAYQDVIDACTHSGERKSARERLDVLRASSGLPQEG